MFTFGLKVKRARKVIAELRQEARRRVRFVSKVELNNDNIPVSSIALVVDGLPIGYIVEKKDSMNFMEIPSVSATLVRERYIDLLYGKLKKEYERKL